MLQFDATTLSKIAALRVLYAAGTGIEVYELVKIDWPSPDGTIYYSSTQVDEVASVAPSVSPIEARLVPDSLPNFFLPVSIDSTIGDEEVDLKFWDADEVISQLLVDHGEGIKVELFYWFPQETLLLSVWHGHLRFEDEAAIDILPLKAAQGFRSSDGMIPHRAHWQECQRIFGGTLATQALIDDYGCPYNKHLGGSTGINNPSTSLPWTFCDRADTSSCTARGVSVLRHLSHKTIISVVVNNQTSGPRLLSTSAGNETALSQPVRVVMGKRRIYNALIMAYRRDLNNNTPSHGFFQGFYELCEGPIRSISSAVIIVGNTPQAAVSLHYGYRLGKVEQSSADGNLTTHGYSNTAYIRYAYGWVDPTTIQPNDANANALVEGLADVYIQTTETGGSGGLVGTWHRGVAFNRPVGKRLHPTLDLTDLNTTAVTGCDSEEGFGIRFTGQIKPRYTETYTFTTPVNDDIISVTINGTLVINAATYPSTGSGTIALTADTLYDITVDLTQSAAAGSNPWGIQLKWQSTSQALEVVPSSRLYYPDFTAYEPAYTSNRVWQIAKMLTDKRWGFGNDLARLDLDNWETAATWAARTVRFTDTFGTDWDHVRSDSHVELVERKSQQQIEDMCIAGRLSRPFLFNGKIQIVPLSAADSGELAAAPVFTDEGENRNIIWNGDKTTLTVSRKSDLDLVNRVEVSYDYVGNNYTETPLQPVEDIDAQLRAGTVVGDGARKINTKKYTLLGVVDKPQAVKLAWSLLDLGPCDDGGLQNNLRLKFKIWFADAIDLHPEKIISVSSSRLTKYGFTYFRVKKLKRLDNLIYEIEAQAYNETYMNAFETEISPVTPPVEPPIDPPPCTLTFGTVDYVDGSLVIPINPC